MLPKSKTDEAGELSQFCYRRLQNRGQKKGRRTAGIWLLHINVWGEFEAAPRPLCGYSELSAITDSDLQVYCGSCKCINMSMICRHGIICKYNQSEKWMRMASVPSDGPALDAWAMNYTIYCCKSSPRCPRMHQWFLTCDSCVCESSSFDT